MHYGKILLIRHMRYVSNEKYCKNRQISLLNKNRENDPRNELWRPYLEVVERSGASIFVMENVPQLLGTFEHEEIVGAAESLGFTVWQDKLIASDYGVPQTRTRAFIQSVKTWSFGPGQS